MTSLCRDCDEIPKVANAGMIFAESDERVQLMHEGSKVVAGGYYGDWMADIIRNLRGHHEPQEEYIFHHLLKHVRPGSLIVEIGSFWAYYSNWYLGAVPNSRAVCVEPDLIHLSCGRRNLELNDRHALMINACIGAHTLPRVSITRESDNRVVEVLCYNMNGLLEILGGQPIELLHIDAQGSEYPFLLSMRDAERQNMVRFLVISTHHQSISGSPTTHQDCLRLIRDLGGVILAEHSIEESFSGDGLIAASFLPSDRSVFLPECSINQPENSLFGPDPQPLPFEVAQTECGPMIVSKGDSVISRMLLEQRKFEENKIIEVTAFLANNYGFLPELFFDIGANIGTHLIAAMNSGRFSRGLAVEMEENNFLLLHANVILNRLEERVRVFRLALSDKNTIVEMELSDANFGDHRIRVLPGQDCGSFGENRRATQRIQSITLDELVEGESLGISSSTLMWIDTQGHEGHVLSGGRKSLSSCDAPFVVCEVWPYGLERAGGRQQLFAFLERCAAFYDINSDEWSTRPPLSLEQAAALCDSMLASPEGHMRHTDFLCIPANTKLHTPNG